jgi:hypothetical protein
MGDILRVAKMVFWMENQMVAELVANWASGTAANSVGITADGMVEYFSAALLVH